MGEIIYSKFSNERAPQFNIRTEIIEHEDGSKSVRKVPMGEQSRLHVSRMLEFYKSNREHYATAGISLCPCRECKEGLEFSFLHGADLNEALLRMVEENDVPQFYKYFDFYLEFMDKQGEKVRFEASEEFSRVFGECTDIENRELKVCCPSNIDVIFDNIVCTGDEWFILDYEWFFDFAVPVNFIIYRSIFYLLYCSPHVELLKKMDLYQRAGITEEEILLYEKMERRFQKYVVSGHFSVQRYYQEGIDIKKIMAEQPWKEKELAFQIYINTGNGISEETSYRVNQPLEHGTDFCFVFDIPEETIELRIDPGDEPIVLYLENAEIFIEKTNGQWQEDGGLYFGQKDPWIYVRLSELEENRILLKGQVGKVTEPIQKKLCLETERIDDLAERTDNLQKENAQLEENVELLREHISLIVNGKSWKILRRLRNIYRKLLGRPQEVSSIDEVLKKTAVQRPKQGIGIHLHLFYVDLLDEFLQYFSNIPYKFSLYISCVEGADVEKIRIRAQEVLSNAEKVDVRIFENQGRDIAPFYVGFHDELMQHEYVLHMHSKKSKHIATGGGDWRQYSQDSLVGSRERVEEIIGLFRKDKKAGLVYPECHPDIPMIGYTWMGNAGQGRQLLEGMGIAYREGLFNYPAGSFFWVRMDAIEPLMNKKFTLQDFPKEAGQIDGTLAHVLERALAFVVQSRGYHSYIVDIEEKCIRCDRSTKPYREFLNKDKEAIQEELEQYDSISFALFDTLVDFIPCGQNAIVKLVQDKFGFDNTFVRLRLEAERRARGKYGSAMRIDDIYGELSQISNFDDAVVDMLKRTELELLQLYVEPRQEIQEIYRNLIQKGKKVAVVCDTYYPKEVIEAILVKCGFLGYENLWVSCECGVSKRDEQLWNIVYQTYDTRHHVHVGSDVYADWYTLERRGAASLWVMSAEEAYRLSKEYDPSWEEKDYSLEEALEMGNKIKRQMFHSTFGLGASDVLI